MLKKIILFFVFTSCIFASTQVTTGFSVKLDAGALNKAVNIFARSSPYFNPYEGTVAGMNYKIQLHVPEFIFENELLKIKLTFTAELGGIISPDFSVTPEVEVPATSIDLLTVIAELKNFSSHIVGNNDIPDILESIIVNYYNDLQPWVYPEKLLEEINDDYMSSISGELTNIELAEQLTDANCLELKLNLYFETDIPEISCYITNDRTFQITTNCDVRILKLKIYNSIVQELFSDETPHDLNVGQMDPIFTTFANQPFYLTVYVEHLETERYFVLSGSAGGWMGIVNRFN